MSSRKLRGAQYRKRKAKQEQETQKSEKLPSFLTKRPVEQSKTSRKIQTLVNLELVDPEEIYVHLSDQSE